MNQPPVLLIRTYTDEQGRLHRDPQGKIVQAGKGGMWIYTRNITDANRVWEFDPERGGGDWPIDWQIYFAVKRLKVKEIHYWNPIKKWVWGGKKVVGCLYRMTPIRVDHLLENMPDRIIHKRGGHHQIFIPYGMWKKEPRSYIPGWAEREADASEYLVSADEKYWESLKERVINEFFGLGEGTLEPSPDVPTTAMPQGAYYNNRPTTSAPQDLTKYQDAKDGTEVPKEWRGLSWEQIGQKLGLKE